MRTPYTGNLENDPSLRVFSPDWREDDMVYSGLHCTCGGQAFRLAGWPRSSSGGGGYFWRAVARVWREARLPMKNGELVESAFRLPIFARCERCDQEEKLLDHPEITEQMSEAGCLEPKEFVRCRICRRGHFALVIGLVFAPVSDSLRKVLLVAQCQGCRREVRVAWSDGRISDREIQLDLLYGRR